MNQYVSQEEVRRIIISDMVKKRNSIVPLAILWLSYGTLKWFRGAFEEGLRFMRRHSLLTHRGALPYETGLVVSLAHFRKRMDIGLGSDMKVIDHFGEI